MVGESLLDRADAVLLETDNHGLIRKLLLEMFWGDGGGLRARSVISANLGLWAKSISTSHALSCSYALAWKLQEIISLGAKDGRFPITAVTYDNFRRSQIPTLRRHGLRP